jgi:hypothetical protein
MLTNAEQLVDKKQMQVREKEINGIRENLCPTSIPYMNKVKFMESNI